jgi:hypothetical protein
MLSPWKGVAAFALAMTIFASSRADQAEPPLWLDENSPQVVAPAQVRNSHWQQLDELIDGLAASRDRDRDGQFKLYLATHAIYNYLEANVDPRRISYDDSFGEYGRARPQSAFAPILAAMQLQAAAWRARGHGYASTVTREGWQLFRERNHDAYRLIRASKQRSAKLPTWYEQAIWIGMDANAPDEELAAIFKEGVERFPGYHPLYFAYARRLSLRWGGTYETADAFIRSQVAAQTNSEGDALYTRLYWIVDQYNGGDRDFFENSQVDWKRMRAGFRLLVHAYPQSDWNRENFAVFACRAGDAATYRSLRPSLYLERFQTAAPEGISIDVCDARFMQRS